MRTETNLKTGEVTTHEDAPVQARPQNELDAEFNSAVDAELREIDFQSIRSLREWVASQPGAPQWIIDKESEASAKRATRKP